MGSKGGSTTTSTQSLPKEFLTGYKNALKMAGQAVSTPYEAYQGQLVAGLNDTQQQGIANVNAAQGMALPAISEGMDLTRKAAEGITPELYNQFYSPYVRDVGEATQRNLLESNAQQTSGLKSGAIQAGAFGGDRGGVAQAEMARQQDLANGQTMSNVWNQGYGQAMQLAGQQAQNYGVQGQQMAGLGTAAQGSVLQGAQAQMAAGAQQQSTEQAQLSAAYDQYMQRLAYPYQQAQFYANIAEGLGSSAGGTSTTTTPGPSWGSQIFGGLGALGSIFSMSDERTKEDVEPIGELFDGQQIYRYRFKDEPKGTTRIGLMAQDVEKRNPRAVREFNGIKGVDYRDATDEAASTGGLVPRGHSRMPFAEGGGIPFYPWGDARGWVPEGKLDGNGGNRIPEKPGKYDPGSLDEDWGDLKPLDQAQLSGLGRLTYTMGIPTGGRVNQARGGLARSHYATGGASAPVIMPDAPDEHIPTNEEVDAYVAAKAAEKGVDPDVALRLWHAEGRSGNPREAWRAKGILKDGERESSYGPFQLNMKGGVGEAMLADTGVDPSKVENWKPSVDYALDHAKKNGWDDWMGAKAIGLKSHEGLPGGEPGGVMPASDSDPVPSGGFTIPGQRRGLSRFIAGEDNPSIIESVMGKRLSPEARNAILAGSFATLAGRSPFMGVNIGEGGKVGLKTYYNALSQRADIANTVADIKKKAAETQGLTLEQKRHLFQLYQQSALNYNVYKKQAAPPFMPFADWAKQFGFPDLGIQGPTAPGGTAPSPRVNEAPVLTDPDAADASGKPGERPQLGKTVLADPKNGPSPDKPNTLPFWQHIASGWAANQGQISLASPEQAQTYIAQQEAAQRQIEAIQGSEGYKAQEKFNDQYTGTRQALEKLAVINSKYQGGRLADVKADILGVAQSLGITLPEGWADNPAAYDEIMKNAMTVAIRNAEQSGGFTNAPASMLDAAGHVTPVATMSPAARYSMIRTMLADLDYKNDLFATWDQGPNFARHQAEFRSENPFENYMDHAAEVLPQPSLPENAGDPSDPANAAASGQPVAGDKQAQYDAKAPNAPDGTEIHNRKGDVLAVRIGGKWVAP